MNTAACMRPPVQRLSPLRPKATGHSLNVVAQCDQSSDEAETCPLETEWITEVLIARTRDAWGRFLGREVDREEAIEMLLNVQHIAMAFHLVSMEGDVCQ
ncbi:MAG: hypothetical protein WD534_01580 [Phycisphaeraceae bacterium]